MTNLSEFSEWFWDPAIWLPPSMTWNDFESKDPNIKLVHLEEAVYCALYLTILLIVARYLVIEPYVFYPLGRKLGIKEETCRKPPFNKHLESIHLLHKGKKIPYKLIQEASQQLEWTDRQIERWLRQRKASERPALMFKFCDCSWQLLYYTLYCGFGVYVLYDKPWLWNIETCWVNHPMQNVDDDIWWYCMIPLGFYISSTLTFLYQHQRKDSLQMMIHHVITIFLILACFVINIVRMGTLILLVHECADIPLQIAKICGYINKKKLMDYFFVIFTLLWIATRLIIYPLWIMRSSMYDSLIVAKVEVFPMYYVLIGCQFLLLFFHAIWTFLIIRIIIQKIKSNEIKDVRSDSDELSEQEMFNEKVEINGNGHLVHEKIH